MSQPKTSQEELEFKIEVTQSNQFASFLRHLQTFSIKISKPKLIPMTDYYLETSKNAKKRVRIRRVGVKWCVTAKSVSELRNGLVRRTEETHTLRNIRTLHCAIQKAKQFYPNTVGTQILFTIKNQRSIYRLSLERLRVEMCFDRVTITRQNKKVRMKEIELELMQGSPAAFKTWINRLIQICGFRPAKQSKVKTALNAFKL